MVFFSFFNFCTLLVLRAQPSTRWPVLNFLTAQPRKKRKMNEHREGPGTDLQSATGHGRVQTGAFYFNFRFKRYDCHNKKLQVRHSDDCGFNSSYILCVCYLLSLEETLWWHIKKTNRKTLDFSSHYWEIRHFFFFYDVTAVTGGPKHCNWSKTL